jgi:hypothetical protein
MATGYDPKKAEAYNKLRQQGLSDEAAFKQSGISDADADNYVVNDVPGDPGRGTIGPFIVGTGTKTQAPTAAEQKESAQFYKGLESSNFERVDYPVKADSQPKTKTVTTWTSTSTEQVSGGGSTTTTAGAFKENSATRALQPEIDAKQAELKQSYKDYPVSNRGREQAGLPLLTPDELQANQQRATEISKQKVALEYKQQDAGTPGEPTVTTVPNTTTTESTTTYGKTVTNSGLSNVTTVQTPGGPDPVIEAQTETQIATSDVPAGSISNAPNSTQDPYNGGAGAGRGFVNPTAAPESVDQGNSPYASQRAQQNEQIEAAAPEPPDQTDAETARLARQEAVAADAPAPVDPRTSPYGSQRVQQQEQTEAVAVSQAADQENPYAEGGGVEPPSSAAVAENDALAAAGAAASQEAATKQRAQDQQVLQARFNTPANGDWRVRLRLAPNSTYLYNSNSPGILAPLKTSDGVIFPYTPTISTTYSANYDATDLTHSNYKGQFYKNSSVGEVALNGIFTAQDTAEAEYMLAVIHFFRSVTKMFYGQDAERGTPPPLVYLFGLGQYQFNNHPCVVKTFNYSLPNDVDYIRTQPNNYGQNLLNRRTPAATAPGYDLAGTIARIGNAVDKLGNLLNKGALPFNFGPAIAAAGGVMGSQAVYNTNNATYVPTKIDIQLTLMPIQTRSQVSQQFSLKGFANGDLLKGGFW